MKLLVWLKLTGIPHKIVETINQGPTSQWPWVYINGEVIADSSNIIDRLSVQFKADLDAHLTQHERSVALAFQRLTEDHLNNVMVYYRWLVPAGWNQWKANFNTIPWPIRLVVAPMIRKQVRKKLTATGIARFPYEVALERAKKDVDALADQLGKNPYFGGSSPATLDCSVYGLFYQILSQPVADSPLADYVRSKQPILEKYVERMNAKLYPKA